MTYGQYSRGVTLSFVEPYLLEQRIALGLDLSYRQQKANSYTSYGVTTLGLSPRVGLALREDTSLQLRYSLYQQRIELSSAYNNCNNNASNASLAYYPTPAYIKNVLGGVDPVYSCDSSYYGYGCYGDGESSLPVRQGVVGRRVLDIGRRLHADLQYARQQQEPDGRTADRLAAGFCWSRRQCQLPQ
ncbi:hypothetical protein BRDID11002_11020 [Bradyrhizobium diazoefficiens]